MLNNLHVYLFWTWKKFNLFTNKTGDKIELSDLDSNECLQDKTKLKGMCFMIKKQCHGPG